MEIYDHKGLWEGPGGLVGPLNKVANPNDKAPATKQVACKFSKEEVQDLIEERTNARRGRDFERADEIRDLLASSGVELYDKLNEWATYDGSMSGLQSTDFYTGFSNAASQASEENTDMIKVEDPETGEVSFKMRTKQYDDPDEDEWEDKE